MRAATVATALLVVALVALLMSIGLRAVVTPEPVPPIEIIESGTETSGGGDDAGGVGERGGGTADDLADD